MRAQKRAFPLAGVLAGLVLAGAVAGCGGTNIADIRAAVDGKVTLDGQPLKEGRISFFPTGDTQGPVAGGEIADGSYKIALEKGVAIGMNRVTINSARKTGKKIKSAESGNEIDETEEAVPPQFNTHSKEERTIAKGENHNIDFELKSK